MIWSDTRVCACADFKSSVWTSSSRNAVTRALRVAQRARRGVSSPAINGCCLRGRGERMGAVSGISHDCGFGFIMSNPLNGMVCYLEERIRRETYGGG